MIFLNLGALFGLAAIGIPILIHLLNKMQVKEVHWAAMRFLLESVQKNQRRVQIEDLLLLLLRCILIALFFLALSRPTIQSGSHAVGSHVVTAVIIMDNSYSMGLTNGIQSSFQRAQNAAEQILQALPSGSSSAFFFAADNVQPVISQPTFDFNLLRQTIRQAKLTDRSTNLGESLQLAVSTLQKQGEGTSKEIYLITDGQANGWGSLDELQKQLAEVQKQITVHLILVGGEPESNIAVTGLGMEGGLTPINQPLRCRVEVTNEGDAEVRDVRVNLLVDDQPAVDQTILDRISPGASRTVALFAKLRTDGFHSITAQVPPDRLAADDRRTIAVKSVQEVKILLVEQTPGATPSQSEDFFVRNALVPVPPSDVSQYYIKTTTVSSQQLDGMGLDPFDAVFLLGVNQMSSSAVSALTGYVRQGGGLVIFPGVNCNPQFYNDVLGHDGFLPASIGAVVGNPNQQSTFFSPQDNDYDHSIVSLWNEPGSGRLSTAHFYAYYKLTPQPASPSDKPNPASPAGPARVVLHFQQNTDPIAVEHDWGAGQVILFASTGTTAWNDLPVSDAFVPLVHRSLGSLVARQTEGLNIRVGQKFSYVVSSDLLNKNVSISVPGQTDPPRTVGQVTPVNSLPTLEFRDTDEGGAYQVTVASSPPTSLIFAAQPDPAESNLTPLSAAQVKSLSDVADIIKWNPDGKNALTPTLTTARVGWELWTPLLIIALVIGVIETLLAQRFTQSK